MADPSEVLFTVTAENLDSGLRGIPVGTCRTSSVDPYTGVHYVGMPISELVGMNPVEVIYLLLNKHLPNTEEAGKLLNHLSAHSELPPLVLDVLPHLAKSAHPMKTLASCIDIIASDLPHADAEEQVYLILARMPALMASILRLREGRSAVDSADLSGGIVEGFVTAYGPPLEKIEGMKEIVRTFFILHLDHGGGNLSTFTAKAVASGKADVTSAMASAMHALSGPLHGRANQSCLEFVRRVKSNHENEVEAFVRSELESGRPIYGFGHAVLRAEDPRATLQIEVGKRICPSDEYFRTVCTLRKVASQVLAENPKISNPNANVDLVSGTLLHAVGLRDPETYTTFFGWSRTAGIGAQILDERRARNGKGVPIYRPKFIHVTDE